MILIFIETVKYADWKKTINCLLRNSFLAGIFISIIFLKFVPKRNASIIRYKSLTIKDWNYASPK